MDDYLNGCSADRTMPVGLTDRLINAKYAERPNTVRPYSKKAGTFAFGGINGGTYKTVIVRT